MEIPAPGHGQLILIRPGRRGFGLGTSSVEPTSQPAELALRKRRGASCNGSGRLDVL